MADNRAIGLATVFLFVCFFSLPSSVGISEKLGELLQATESCYAVLKI